MNKIFFLCLTASFFAIACSSGGGAGNFLNTKAMAVDSVNDLAFFIEANQQIFVRTASTNDGLPDQPAIDEDRAADDAVLALVPELVTQAVAYPDGDDTNLFLLGSNTDADGATTLNSISVLQFDGEDFSEASISPVVLTDDDEATDETDDTFSAMVADVANAQIFVTNFTTAQIYVLDATTGDNKVAPIAVQSEPAALALDGDSLYLCHSDAALSEQMTVINTLDYTEQTFTLNAPCQDLTVATNANGTVLAVKRGDAAIVDLYVLDTDDLTLTPIPTAEEDFTDGQLVSGFGFTSTISAMLLTVGTDGNIYGYFAEQDGNVQVVTVEADLSAFSHQTISTSALNYLSGAAYVNDAGEAPRVYFIGEAGFVLSVENADGDLDADLDS